MKITKRQLRKLIRESHPRAVVDDAMVDYEMWVEEKGHVTTGSSSVMATYILDKGIEDDHELHQTLADAFKLDHDDVMRDLKRQQEERSINMGESRAKITKRQLKRIIKEERSRLLKEDMDIITDMADELEKLVQKYMRNGLDEADMDEAWEVAKGDWF